MEEERVRELLEAVRNQQTSIDEALQQLRQLPYETLGDFARLDHHRTLRRGFPEVILAQGKTPEQVVQIFRRLEQRSNRVLATRVSAEMYAAIHDQLPEATYHPLARLLYLDHTSRDGRPSGIVIVSAGTADIPVAEEAAITAELTGSQVERIYDVGVAGLHRLLDQTHALQRARVIVVVAGMEGALASVVTGLVSSPVIAVPTSVGYGASFGGLAALLAMLNSCANGVAVVNIDNGFGAGYLAGIINRIGRSESAVTADERRMTNQGQ
jgi:NCAIR mutase (PurE)-related protein